MLSSEVPTLLGVCRPRSRIYSPVFTFLSPSRTLFVKPIQQSPPTLMIRRPDTPLPHAYEAMGNSKVVRQFPLSHTPFKSSGPDVFRKSFVGLQQVERLKTLRTR